jgi:protein-tyrosine phosphatase
MVETAKEHGLILGGAARQVRPNDLGRFDLILAMDESNRADLLELARTPAQRTKIRMLREFDPQRDELDVPDPWYGGRGDFEQTYQIIERSVRGLLEALERGEV